MTNNFVFNLYYQVVLFNSNKLLAICNKQFAELTNYRGGFLLRSFDGINHKKKPEKIIESSSFDDQNALKLPTDLSFENIQPDIIIYGKKDTSKKHKLFSSPLGLKSNKAQTKHKSRPFNKKYFFKILLASSVLCLLVFLLIQVFRAKNEISYLSNESKIHLTKAMLLIEDGDMPASLIEANIADQKIKRLKILSQSWGQDMKFLNLISPDSKLVAVEQLLDATYTIVNTLTEVNQKIVTLGGKQDEAINENKSQDFLFNINESRTVVMDIVNVGLTNLKNSRAQLYSVKNNLNQENQDQVENAISSIDKTILSLEFVDSLTRDNLPWLSGADGTDKNILVLLQNNSELRGGSGGSLGSFGVAKFSGGKLTKIDFGKNIYKIDQAFETQAEKIEVPKELVWLRGEKTWTLKDSGWAVDGDEAFSKIIWFYEKETGENLDGAIMIDTTAVISLLKETGPIEMPTYQKTIDSSNFRTEVEYEVHKGYFGRVGSAEENEPKKILSDLMPIFMDKVFNGLSDKDQSIKILSSISKSIKRKDITLFFKNDDFQNKIDKLNYSGSVLPTVGDYLYVNNSNIDGAKSSLNVLEKINLTTEIKTDGKIENNLNIKRTHIGEGVWPDGINKNFIRLLFPDGTKISEFNPIAGDFREFLTKEVENNYYLSSESNKSVINFWMNTNPKEESKVLIKYTPNYSISIADEFVYQIDFQKQPGSLSDEVNLTIKFPEGFYPINVTNYNSDSQKINLIFSLDRDRTIKIRFKKI